MSEDTTPVSATWRAYQGTLQQRWRSFVAFLIDSDVVLTLSVAALYAWATFGQTKYMANDGLGDDGVHYASYAKDFPGTVLAHRVDSYFMQRTLPSLIVWAGLTVGKLPKSNLNIVYSFGLMNIVLVTLAAYVWCKCARLLTIRAETRWLGTLLIFGGFAIMKWSTWAVVMTDTWGFALGLLLLWCYLSNRVLPLVVTTIAGAFAWPSLLHMGALLLMFGDRSAVVSRAQFKSNQIVAVISALMWGAFCYQVHITGFSVRAAIFPPVREVIWLSVVLSAGYVYIILSSLLERGDLLNPFQVLKRIVSLRGITALVLLLLVPYLQARASSDVERSFTLDILKTFALTSTSKPAGFIVAHVVFYGPIILLIVLRWSQFCAVVRRFGTGAVVVTLFGALLAVNSESRHILAPAAFALPFAVKLLDERQLDTKAILGLGALALLFSKLWMQMPAVATSPIANFPSQLYGMNNGPWMSLDMYFYQGLVVFVAGYWLARALERTSLERTPGAPPPSDFTRASL